MGEVYAAGGYCNNPAPLIHSALAPEYAIHPHCFMALMVKPDIIKLEHWPEFNALRRDHKKEWHESIPQGLTTRINIFAARFDVAIRLKSITFSPELDGDTMQAYLAGSRLLLAYSAAEAYMRAEDLFRKRKPVGVTSWSISRAGLAERIAPLVKLIIEKAYSHGAHDSTTKKNLENFISCGKPDVRPIATALRHVHAHGGLTARSIAGDASFQGAIYVECINELARALLELSDEKFSGLVKEISVNLNSTK